jgi:hypothetical protein
LVSVRHWRVVLYLNLNLRGSSHCTVILFKSKLPVVWLGIRVRMLFFSTSTSKLTRSVEPARFMVVPRFGSDRNHIPGRVIRYAATSIQLYFEDRHFQMRIPNLSKCNYMRISVIYSPILNRNRWWSGMVVRPQAPPSRLVSPISFFSLLHCGIFLHVLLTFCCWNVDPWFSNSILQRSPMSFRPIFPDSQVKTCVF